MQKIRQWFLTRRSFLVGFALASLLFGGVASAGMIAQQITAYFPNYAMKFNGVAKAPPADQQPILVNGRTYVPLRFIAEAMGHPVEFEAATQTIYVGARPDKNRPSVLLKPEENVSTTRWSGSNDQYKQRLLYLDPAPDVNAKDRANSWIVQVFACSRCPFGTPPEWVAVEKDYVLNGQYSKLSGTLFPGLSYNGAANGRNAGYLVVKDEYDKEIYRSPWIRATGLNDDVKFSVDVKGVGKVKLVFVVAPNVAPKTPVTDVYGGDPYTAELGVENLGLD